MDIFKKTALQGFSISVLALAIIACGGGSDDSAPTATPTPSKKLSLTGVVATGRPLANASITVKCNGGVEFKGVADSNGKFNIPLEKASNTPCMLRAEKGSTVYFSYAEKEGDVHINPLTDLTLAKALKNQPQDIFNKFGDSIDKIDSRDINDASQFALSAVEVISGYKTINYAGGSPSLFTYKFEIGDDRDKLLDALAATANNSKLSYNEIRNIFIDNAEYRENFGEKVWEGVIGKNIQPLVDKVKCNQPVLMPTLPISTADTILKCVVTGKNLAYPARNILASGAVLEYPLGISVSRNSLQQPRANDSELPYNPVWCSLISTQIDSAKSTDSDDPLGPDPTGSFKEELVYQCRTVINFEDDLEVEVIHYRHPRNSLGQEQAGYAWLRYFDTTTNKLRPSEIVSIDSCSAGSELVNGVCKEEPKTCPTEQVLIGGVCTPISGSKIILEQVSCESVDNSTLELPVSSPDSSDYYLGGNSNLKSHPMLTVKGVVSTGSTTSQPAFFKVVVSREKLNINSLNQLLSYGSQFDLMQYVQNKQVSISMQCNYSGQLSNCGFSSLGGEFDSSLGGEFDVGLENSSVQDKIDVLNELQNRIGLFKTDTSLWIYPVVYKLGSTVDVVKFEERNVVCPAYVKK